MTYEVDHSPMSWDDYRDYAACGGPGPQPAPAKIPPKAAQALTLLERVRADRDRDARLAEALMFNEAARVERERAAKPINPQGELFA